MLPIDGRVVAAYMPGLVSSSANLGPWGEWVVDSVQRGAQLQIVAQQHRCHSIVLDPVKADLGIDRRR
jgi:hypothetical protein